MWGTAQPQLYCNQGFSMVLGAFWRTRGLLVATPVLLNVMYNLESESITRKGIGSWKGAVASSRIYPIRQRFSAWFVFFFLSPFSFSLSLSFSLYIYIYLPYSGYRNCSYHQWNSTTKEQRLRHTALPLSNISLTLIFVTIVEWMCSDSATSIGANTSDNLTNYGFKPNPTVVFVACFLLSSLLSLLQRSQWFSPLSLNLRSFHTFRVFVHIDTYIPIACVLFLIQIIKFIPSMVDHGRVHMLIACNTWLSFTENITFSLPWEIEKRDRNA